MKANISVIIPNYNGSEYLTECLTSLNTAMRLLPNSCFETIIVDNGSTDDSQNIIEKLAKSFPQIHLRIINLHQNFGFSKAVNVGIKSSIYPYVFLLNNDLVLEKEWLFKIITSIENNKDRQITTFCGTILTKDGNYIESLGLDFHQNGKCTNLDNKLKFQTHKISPTPKLIWGGSAAAIVYDKAVLTEIGLFDEDFFAYEEDVDVALRLNLLGYKTILVGDAISYHLGGGTSGKMGNFRNIHDAKNWFFIIIKNYSFASISKSLIPIIVERLRNFSGLVKSTIYIYRLRSIYILPISLIKAYGPVLTLLPKMLLKRQQFQNLLKSVK